MSDVDLDRAAILARRQRFIAIALSSLAGVACTSRAGKPQVCLSPPMPQTEDGSQGDPEPPVEEPPIEQPPVEEPPGEKPPVEEPPGEEPPTKARPHACLNFSPLT